MNRTELLASHIDIHWKPSCMGVSMVCAFEHIGSGEVDGKIRAAYLFLNGWTNTLCK